MKAVTGSGVILLVITLILAGCGAQVTLDASSNPSVDPGAPGALELPTATTLPTTTTTVRENTPTTLFQVVDPITGATIVSCETSDGSSLDLAAEPTDWPIWDSYIRWSDADGCPLRLDVVAHVRGSDRCGWQGAEFITMGRPIGGPIGKRYSVESTSRFLWDPDAVLPRGPFGELLDSEDLEAPTVDSGFRLMESQRSTVDDLSQTADGSYALHVDDLDDPTILYLRLDGRVEVWHKHPSLGLCG